MTSPREGQSPSPSVPDKDGDIEITSEGERTKSPSPDSQGKGLFHGLFRRHSESSTEKPKLLTDEGEQTNSKQSDSNVREDDHNTEASDVEKGQLEHQKRPDTPEQRRHSMSTSHSSTHTKGHHRRTSLGGSPLTRKDIISLFTGAPFFLVEKGKHHRCYPQVIFPWDYHGNSILNIWDRKPLPHVSYTLCTLHAHLPVPDGWVIKGDTPVRLDNWKRSDAPKRATFDIGVFEVPNMLSMNGKEPGTIGFRYFLELPVADSVIHTGSEKPRERSTLRRLSEIHATEAYEFLERFHSSYSQCHDGTVHDRKKLISDGPTAWKAVGVRDADLNCLIDRLKLLRQLRQEIVYGKKEKTILDVESPRELYDGLYTNFLYAPPHALAVGGDKHCLKSQIKVLNIVLSTPGAWFDFNLPEWRLRVGQVLWEYSPHFDGDFLRFDGVDSQKSGKRDLERKWFLIQMLLAGELLLRLDAVVRMSLVDSEYPAISMIDVQTYGKLRNDKIDWDLVVVRRFLDTLDISSRGTSTPPRQEKSHRRRLSALFEGFAHKDASSIESSWDIKLVTSHVGQQLQGLLAFAENIGWPGIDSLKARIESVFGVGEAPHATMEIHSSPAYQSWEHCPRLGKQDMHSRRPTRRLVLLHDPHHDPREPNPQPGLQMGGWATRSWLSGFVIPGEAIIHLLICTLLENDTDAMAKLGPLANLYGGFSYNGRTWWSKQCIVGRVLASMDGAEACMGWMSIPIIPRDTSTEPMMDTWFEVLIKPPLTKPGKPRIKQGNRLAMESTPLGRGELSSDEFSLPVDQNADSEVAIEFQGLTFPIVEERKQDKFITMVKEPVMSFSLSSFSSPPTTIYFPLSHNVWFIASHECRPPFGIASYHAPFPDKSPFRGPQEYTRLPSHLLHKSYLYRYTPLGSLSQTSSPIIYSSDNREEVLIIDARGSRVKETFARAWCASVGAHAMIGRFGKTCLACCVREALALDIGVVIRVGNRG